MPAIDDYTCPACKTIFDTTHGRDSHLRQSSKCSWYRAGKIAEWAAYTIEELRDEPLEDVSRIVLDDQDLFHFIPPTVLPNAPPSAPPTDVDIGEAGPGPSTQAYRDTLSPEPDPDLYSRIIDEDTTAGHVVRMADKLHDLWRQQFSAGGGSSQDDGTLPFTPFASEMDWRIAHWVITDNIGHASLDRLLAIPGVCESLGLSFHNTRSLHQNLDEIPLRAGSWSTKILRFRDRPDDAHLIRMRDPVEAVRSLWGDPTLAKHLVYRPQKIFDSAKRDNRFFSEMWTGDW
ncbi:uncharacterized protein SCHCODRAFT_02498405, partial [Schizophyllum commune H4-8]|uniref:uncharacterized protein n=1 Tax=Schizophyllum commune (strain H4-8 / FGSC 9210) TaxID=578458 RepID=UPI00215E3CD1